MDSDLNIISRSICPLVAYVGQMLLAAASVRPAAFGPYSLSVITGRIDNKEYRTPPLEEAYFRDSLSFGDYTHF